MNDFLVNLARRAAGLPLSTSASPVPHAPIDAAVETDAAAQVASSRSTSDETADATAPLAEARFPSAEVRTERVIVPISAADGPSAQRSALMVIPTVEVNRPQTAGASVVPDAAPSAPHVGIRTEIVIREPSEHGVTSPSMQEAPLLGTTRPSSASQPDVRDVSVRPSPIVPLPLATNAPPRTARVADEPAAPSVARVETARTLLTGGPAMRRRVGAASAPQSAVAAPVPMTVAALDSTTRPTSIEVIPDDRAAAHPSGREGSFEPSAVGTPIPTPRPARDESAVTTVRVEPAPALPVALWVTPGRDGGTDRGDRSEERVIEVRIGSVDVRSTPAAPPPIVPAPVTATLPTGFDDVVALRTYAPWKW